MSPTSEADVRCFWELRNPRLRCSRELLEDESTAHVTRGQPSLTPYACKLVLANRGPQEA
eukprot:1005940-Rhodomonas_salina.1